MQRSALCRSRRELSNAYLLTKFRFDTAENEPAKKFVVRSAFLAVVRGAVLACRRGRPAPINTIKVDPIREPDPSSLPYEYHIFVTDRELWTGFVSVPGSRRALRTGEERRGDEQDRRKLCKPCTLKVLLRRTYVPWALAEAEISRDFWDSYSRKIVTHERGRNNEKKTGTHCTTALKMTIERIRNLLLYCREIKTTLRPAS